jgi:hypothetical protein
VVSSGAVEIHCLQLEAMLLIFVAIETGGKTDAALGHRVFWGRSDVDEERGFTGASSFLWDRKVLTQAAETAC